MVNPNRLNTYNDPCDICGGPVDSFPTHGPITCQKCCPDHDFVWVARSEYECKHCDAISDGRHLED